MRAIETQYKGYRFRSRLEARWAVFFDALGVQWEYEKEGYELPSGRYLPDFWLPYGGDDGDGLFLEVKGNSPTDEEFTLAEELARETGRWVDAVCGPPGLPSFDGQSYRLYGFHGRRLRGSSMNAVPRVWFPHIKQSLLVCIAHKNLVFCQWDDNGLSSPYLIDSQSCNAPGCTRWVCDDAAAVYGRMVAAVGASRAARFEFGECG